MRPLVLLLALSLAACGSAEKQDLANAGKARSLLAEAALIVELAPRTPATYSARIREEAAQELASLAGEARSAGGPEGAEIAQVVALPEPWDADLVRQRAARARAIEARIEGRLEGR